MSELSPQRAIFEGPATPPEEGSRFARAHHILLYFVAGSLAIWLLSGIYQVRTDQVAIVERLGQYLQAPDGSPLPVGYGLHYHLPWPIDRVNIISNKQSFPMTIDAFSASPTAYDNFKRDLMRKNWDSRVINALFDPYLITADKSVANVEVSVQFHIADPAAWLNSVSHEYQQTYDPSATEDMRNGLFQQVAQRVVISQVATMPLEQVVQEGRTALQRGIFRTLEDGLQIRDPADSVQGARISLGVQLESVTVSRSKVPDAVKPAYDDLMTQRQKAETVQRTAAADAAATVAKAEGERTTLIADANTYKTNTVQAATGEYNRIVQILPEYNSAPDVTRWNLYADAVRAVSGGAKRIVFAQPGQKTIIVVDPPQYDPNQVTPGK